ncbi:hypothetical protein Q8F55_004318 [Vanrija albida]|uniref:EF-hand domain-containing protein n=1 Tax=Vanrija albida TaxID=181172 RepID=A0ABR3Q724_9TREE
MNANASSSSSSGSSASSSSSSTSPSSSPPTTPSSDDVHYPLAGGSSKGISLREPPAADLREAPAADIVTPAPLPIPATLADFRAQEGPTVRAAKLRSLWQSLPDLPNVEGDKPTPTQLMRLPGQDTLTALSPERAERLQTLYQEELVRRVGETRPDALLWGGADDLEPVDTKGGVQTKGISWKAFRRFLWDQERELWEMFQELDRNADGVLDATELKAALQRSGIRLSDSNVQDIVRFLSMGDRWRPGGDTKHITFPEFRDFLMMLPRRATPTEIWKFYQVHKKFGDGRGAARVDKDGDLTASFPKAPGSPEHSTAAGFLRKHDHADDKNALDTYDDDDDEDEPLVTEGRHEAWRFLVAGGVAGAVSRSVTAPFDRLKVYLITSTSAPPPAAGHSPFAAAKGLWTAVVKIYQTGGGVKAFWVGNGLNVAKILPESAIKFVSYEQSKRFLAKYWDKVTDPADISSSSRFIAGGIGGITSQLAIYGLETLKTRVQSELGPSQGWRAVRDTARVMWAQGGMRSYYRGLTLGLVGVFPYSAIDMGTYETLKVAYCKSMETDEPPVFAVLTFGALSGSIGAASVYPINLLRTRLQASGSSGHPHQYNGFMDVLQTTLRNEGWRGLYKGLLPSILKVGPAVGVSWIVYEDAKRRLGVS